MSDDTPTERFIPSDGAGEPPGRAPDDKERRSRKLIMWLAVLGGVLLLVLVIVLTLLFSRGSSSGPVASPSMLASTTPAASPPPTPSQTPSASASESPSENPVSPPDATGMHFTSFDASQELRCSAASPGFAPTIPTVLVSWTTEGADEAWYVNGESDAANSGYLQIPLNGNQADFPFDQPVSCMTGSHTFTITLVGADGTHLSKTTTVPVTGDQF